MAHRISDLRPVDSGLGQGGGSGPSARAQKWLEQLCQVESRLLSNWEEFVAHRAEVQRRLQELARKQDPHEELEKFQRRLQQLSQNQEETTSRVGDLKNALETSQQSMEGLRGRVSTKLQEMAQGFEDQQREVLRAAEELISESAASSKRQSKAVAEELLKKMAELNHKLGENMTSVEEESLSRFEGLKGEVQDLSKRLDASREAERKAEAQWRTLRGEAHAQLEDLAEVTRTESARVKGLQERAQETNQRLESVALEAAAGRQQAAQLAAAQGHLEASLQEHLARFREKMEASVTQESKAQSEAVAQLARKLQRNEELLERCCEASEVEALRGLGVQQSAQLEQLSKTCQELTEARQGLFAEVDGCRSADRQLEDALRRMDARLESSSAQAALASQGVAEVKAFARELAEKAALQVRELLEIRTAETKDLVERCARDSSSKLEALRAADCERQKQVEVLTRSCEGLMEARQGIAAEVEGCRSIDRQLEEALRRVDARVERISAVAVQSSEGLGEAKLLTRELAEQAQQGRELLETRTAELKDLLEQQALETTTKMEALKLSDGQCHQQLDYLSRALQELSEARRGIFAEVESCQSSDRKLEEGLRRMDSRLERLSSLQSQCSEGLVEAKAAALSSAERSSRQAAELETRTAELKETS
ncbi:unnamed protein product [Effrenium voratum]|nr:unnamed protein product [Effrenium voratum]